MQKVNCLLQVCGWAEAGGRQDRQWCPVLQGAGAGPSHCSQGLVSLSTLKCISPWAVTAGFTWTVSKNHFPCSEEQDYVEGEF